MPPRGRGARGGAPPRRGRSVTVNDAATHNGNQGAGSPNTSHATATRPDTPTIPASEVPPVATTSANVHGEDAQAHTFEAPDPETANPLSPLAELFEGVVADVMAVRATFSCTAKRAAKNIHPNWKILGGTESKLEQIRIHLANLCYLLPQRVNGLLSAAQAPATVTEPAADPPVKPSPPQIILKVASPSNAKTDPPGSRAEPIRSPSDSVPRETHAANPLKEFPVSVDGALKTRATGLLIECIQLVVLRCTPRKGIEKDLHEVLNLLLDAKPLEIHPSARRLTSVQELKACIAPWLWEAAENITVMNTTSESGLESVLSMVFFYWIPAVARLGVHPHARILKLAKRSALTAAPSSFNTPPSCSASARTPGTQTPSLDERLLDDNDADDNTSSEDADSSEDASSDEDYECGPVEYVEGSVTEDESSSSGPDAQRNISTDSYNRPVDKHAPGQRPAFVPDFMIYVKLLDGSKKPVVAVEAKHSTTNHFRQVKLYFEQFPHDKDMYCLATRIAPMTRGPGIQVVLYRRDFTTVPPTIIKMHPASDSTKQWFRLTDDTFLEQFLRIRNHFGIWPNEDD
ncbi:uncharacterized protein BXZ73DRAFT_79532 [Epithele typhae]|uniref:uncharacterized protein n=1 Tax=Epithele typhae TaxID=378194 RepID=UPI0020072F4A|nr:uncharacterized protein BXZ73DRAFT_79532 [Epithele typhae]KAH9923472.1 hypothetical protein BXZ73DRAFT_79532 [Epithele typhae]